MGKVHSLGHHGLQPGALWEVVTDPVLLYMGQKVSEVLLYLCVICVSVRVCLCLYLCLCVSLCGSLCVPLCRRARVYVYDFRYL